MIILKELVASFVTVYFVLVLCLILLGFFRALRSLATGEGISKDAIFLPIISCVLIATFLTFIPPLGDDILNSTKKIEGKYIELAESTRYENLSFDVVDLHCDTLLWTHRDILKTEYHPFARNRAIGAVDIPRLIKGNVRTQVFAIVNSVPRRLNYIENLPPSNFKDSTSLLAAVQRWPLNTWFSAKQRVLHQARRLHTEAQRSNGALRVILSGEDMVTSASTVNGILAVEGLSCLEHQLSTVDEFYNAGIRILGPTHFFDTDVGGSLHGTCNCGLTSFGMKVMLRMRQLGMIVDLAHASLQLMSDILNLNDSHRPKLMISHTGLNSICPSQRNLPDKYLQKISERGGIIGITLFDPPLCGDDKISTFVASVSHVANLLGGVKSIGIGSDWDGTVNAIVSAEDTHVLASALLREGNFTEAQTRQIMFENSFEFLKASF